LAGYAALWIALSAAGSAYPMPLGPRPGVFVALMAAIGLFASWLGTLCWNEASQRLPTALAGQLIVFETLAALSYAYLLRGEMPPPLTLIGVALLVGGVMSALRIRPQGGGLAPAS
jgi:drug/metabolite transporter (DMT)-like permease